MNKEALALSICQTLHEKGYIAYFAGGYVRDMILEIPSDDIDIATDASPDVIQSLFSRTIPLGIAFGIVVVILKKESFEVATFRKDLKYKDGRRPEEVAFCSPKEDADRRDFTINGLFYDPFKKEILDYVGGKEDIKEKIIRAIGDPFVRFEEDKLRLIRACRFAARFDFKIDSHTQQAMLAEAPSLFPSVSIERITQELKKMMTSNFALALKLLFEFGLLQEIFPLLKERSAEEIEILLHSFKHMPKEAPMVLHLLELFPKLSIEKQIELIEFLKVSNEELKLATFCLKARVLFEKSTSLQKWVHFYAHKDAEICQKVMAARFSDQKRNKFIEENHSRALQLKMHIERKKTNKPIVTSSDLIHYGITPGKKLGELLNKAEEIAIDNDLNRSEEVIKMLQKIELWNS